VPAFKKRKAEQRRREKEEKKTGRRKEKEASNIGERQTNADNRGLKKKASPADQVSCLLFLAFACILNSLVTVHLNNNRARHVYLFFYVFLLYCKNRNLVFRIPDF
jgi:Flp pilus assembly protein TadB